MRFAPNASPWWGSTDAANLAIAGEDAKGFDPAGVQGSVRRRDEDPVWIQLGHYLPELYIPVCSKHADSNAIIGSLKQLHLVCLHPTSTTEQKDAALLKVVRALPPPLSLAFLSSSFVSAAGEGCLGCASHRASTSHPSP